jgi:protein phosphatase
MAEVSVSQNENWTADPIDIDTGENFFEYAVMAINKRLYEQNEEEAKKWETSKQSNDPIERKIAERLKKKHRMGTTLVSFLIRDHRGYLAHVGDSRAYRIAENGITLLTHDHSWVDERLREGAISPEEAKGHKMRNVITRSVGFKEEVEADIDVITLYPPERFLLCSDGLSNMMKEEELLNFARIENLETACLEMVSAAKSAGGKDNITAVLVEISTSTKGGKAEMPSRDLEDITELPL